jgi:hypothetical protein
VHPDCVLLPGNGAWKSTRRLLTPFDTPVIVITAWDVLKHQANVSLLGTLLGKEARALSSTRSITIIEIFSRFGRRDLREKAVSAIVEKLGGENLGRKRRALFPEYKYDKRRGLA